MTRYRVVTDDYAGFEVQQWKWYWPFWVMSPGPNASYDCNTFVRLEDAVEWIRQLKTKTTPKDKIGKVVYRDD